MSSAFDIFLENLVFKGLEYFNKYYGVYRGKVTDNKDPEKRGRIQAHCPELGQRESLSLWIDPAADYAGNGHGTFWPPEIGDLVRVAFGNGDPSTPVIYYGGWYVRDALPPKLGYDEGGSSQTGTAPIKRGFVTKSGHALVFNDKADNESIELTWKDGSAKLTIDNQAKVTIQTGNSHIVIDKSGKSIDVVDENNNTIQLTSSGVVVHTDQTVSVEGTNGVTVQGANVTLDSSVVNLTSSASEPAVMGQALMTWLTSHVHPTGVGPSGPAAKPPGPDILSTKAKVG